MNVALRGTLTNPWLASLVSFLPIIAVLGSLLLCQPRPMPTGDGIAGMPWWAPLGGLVGGLAVVAGLLFVNKVGAGAFAGLTMPRPAGILTGHRNRPRRRLLQALKAS